MISNDDRNFFNYFVCIELQGIKFEQNPEKDKKYIYLFYYCILIILLIQFLQEQKL